MAFLEYLLDDLMKTEENMIGAGQRGLGHDKGSIQGSGDSAQITPHVDDTDKDRRVPFPADWTKEQKERRKLEDRHANLEHVNNLKRDKKLYGTLGTESTDK